MRLKVSNTEKRSFDSDKIKIKDSSSTQLLSRKDKSSFDRLAFLMSKEDNYKRLRDFISTQSMVSCIPYLGRNCGNTLVLCF